MRIVEAVCNTLADEAVCQQRVAQAAARDALLYRLGVLDGSRSKLPPDELNDVEDQIMAIENQLGIGE